MAAGLGRGIRAAATGWRNAGEVALDRDLTAGNAGKLDGDHPGLVGLGPGVCEEPALGEGQPHGRRRGRPHGGPQGRQERRCLRDGLDGHRGRVDPEDERGEAGEGVIAVGNNMESVFQLLLVAEIFGLASFLNFFPEIANHVKLGYVAKYFAKIQFSPALDL